MTEALHTERQWVAAWVHALVLVSVAGTVAAALAAPPDGSRWTAAIAVALLVVIYGMFSPMTVRVGSEEVRVEFGHVGWPRWRFPIAEITAARVVEFSPLRAYGGWGIRCVRDSTCLNQRGNRGVRFAFRGRDYVIGSDQPERLADALRTVGAAMAAEAPAQR